MKEILFIADNVVKNRGTAPTIKRNAAKSVSGVKDTLSN